MQVISSLVEIADIISKEKENGKTVGFVPTMGALHQGHLSLVNYSTSGNDITVVSIFVNPTQFNDKEDFKKYPRMLDADLKLLNDEKVNFVFAPTEKEMYPEEDCRDFDFGILDKVMEGAHRPGHFKGVAQIVSKLFYAVPAHRVYLGDKDFQQIAIIRKMVSLLNITIQIIPCPIVRENDGLAMSSRNLRLTHLQRKSAPAIYSTLLKSRDFITRKTVNELKKWVIESINSVEELETEYFEIVDENTLQPVKDWEVPVSKVGCIAVKVGNIRLIDNIRYNL